MIRDKQTAHTHTHICTHNMGGEHYDIPWELKICQIHISPMYLEWNKYSVNNHELNPDWIYAGSGEMEMEKGKERWLRTWDKNV